jgi:hypothetical protein
MGFKARNKPVPSYNVGDVVEYKPFGGGLRHVRVTEKHANIKDGFPGFTGEMIWDSRGDHNRPVPDDWGCWGYDRRIVRVNPPDRPATLKAHDLLMHPFALRSP